MTIEIIGEDGQQPPPASNPSQSRSQMFVRMGWGSAIFQAVLVVLGVILGFAVTEWQANAREQTEAQHALSGIIEEIGANRNAVVEARTYHEEKLTTMIEAQKSGAKLDMRVFNRGFVAPAQVSSAAWTSASEVGALAHLPFDQVLSLSRVYAQQQATVANIIYTEIFTRGTEGMMDNAAGLRSIVSTLQYREQQLEEAYAAAIGQYTATMP